MAKAIKLQQLFEIFASEKLRGEIKFILSQSKSRKAQRVSFLSLAGSSASLALSIVSQNKKTPLLVIGDSADDAGYLYHDISRILGEEHVAILPSAYKRDIRFGQIDSPSLILRTDALSRWNSKNSELKIVITYPEAIAEKVTRVEKIEKNVFHIDKNTRLNLTDTDSWLLDHGFNRVDYVYEPGQYAVRGSIIDIFGYNHELPVRIDLFGDEIESMRIFNVETQLSEEKIESTDIVSNVGAAESSGISIMEFMPKGTMVAIRNYESTLQIIKETAEKSFSQSAAIAGEGDQDALKNLIDFDKFKEDLENCNILNFTGGSYTPEIFNKYSLDFECSPQGIYHKNFDIISSSLENYLKDDYKVFILSDNGKQFKRLEDIFSERGENIPFTPVEDTLHEGFIDHRSKICILTDHQIFDRFHKYTLKSERARSGKLALSLKELSSIENGDYIVHVDHGIGRFGGLLRTNVNGKTQEMIKLIYQNNDVIFVSIHSLHKLSKYRGKEGEVPRINKLGTGAWNKMKERTKSKLKDIARDLIKLYAARREEQGFSFSPDSYLQNELEASFIYEDTPDQLTTTNDVKRDMESPRPMDRLICGDVGFGKTEIAIRAAFKAATDGKQTAILVPTTVLAYQHYNTFKERLKDFPVKVEYLSRSKSPKQTKDLLNDLANGKIDIIIGTHKLIGASVKFKDLGLLVIDEEQKFGVGVKEKLKQMKVNVDTLTMSATPIPRTLQFSLMGARDLSAITTPPPNRHPIVTTVSALTDELIAEAVNFELSRNGQIFFINNRIEGLYDLEAQLKRIVPDARTIVVHGRLTPEKMEEAIIAFNNHDYDVLLATTIIESGVDMPNVNTIIINNAQNFGLSELHQLRGRVGRSSRKAFCYLTVPSNVPLSNVARRRLQAIENFSDLGSGIHIAMQDLDIRGAGNLLGAEQSGFIADLGYETYQKVLREAVMEIRTQEFAETFAKDENYNEEYVNDCVIESDLELMFPFDYVPQESERIALYQELDNIEKETDLITFIKNIEDRFGKMPWVAKELVRIPRLRRLAKQLGIEKINLKQNNMYLYFVDQSNEAYYQSPMFGRLVNYLQNNTKRVKIRENAGRRSFLISDVTTVETAVSILEEIVSMESI